MLGIFLIALLILAAAAAATHRLQRRRAAGEVVRQPKDVVRRPKDIERDVYEKLYGSQSSEGSEGTISEAARETRPTPGRLASAHRS
jgi:cell division protein FtsL